MSSNGAIHFPAEFLDELRARTPLASVIKRTVELSKAGSRLKGCCPFHEDDKPSLWVYPDRFKCFGCGKHGDVIDFFRETEHVDFQTAVTRLAAEASLPLPGQVNGFHKPVNGKPAAHKPAKDRKATTGEDWRPMVPPPDDAPEPTARDLKCDMLHTYRDADGKRLFYNRRFEACGKKPKFFLPLVYGTVDGKLGWHGRGPAEPRPLYRLTELAAAPEASVIICEGEKSADAATSLFPLCVCVTWHGGAQTVEMADWQPLIERNTEIIIWPDNDASGHEAAAKIAARLPKAKILRVDDLPEGDDAADVHPDDPDAWLEARLPPEPEVEPPPDDEEADLLKGIWDAGQDDYVIPPRGWLLDNIFCRRFLSSLVADGGVGKTALRIAQLLSLAIGRSLTGDYVHRRCRVLFLSFEDDKDELRRRVYAALRHYNIDPVSLTGWLYLDAPKRLKLAVMNGRGIPEVGILETYLRKAIARFKLDLVVLDPFVKTHALAENDNGAMDMVCDLLASIAIDLDCAIDIPHHTNKGPAAAGDANRGRGASSMKDAGRLVYTLTPMTPEEGQLFDLSEAERRSLVRMDSGKVNIAPPSAEARWFRLVGQSLDNGTDDYPNGDEVQAVEPWDPPDTWAGLDHALLNRILDDIDAGMANGQRYSAAGPATTRAAWRVVQQHASDKSEKACRAVINAWLKSGTLFNENYSDPVEWKERTGLRVNATLRPS
jgi:5S rRNA maturation endonuclease (ribonuclease M5)